MSEFRIDGPAGADPTANTLDTTQKFTLGTKLVTEDTATKGKHRIYRYLKIGTSFTAGSVNIVGSFNSLLYGAINSNAIGARLAVPQFTVTSPSGSSYAWIQTGGWIDSLGALVVSATAGQNMYVASTAGYLTSTPNTFPIPVIGAVAKTNASSAVASIYCPDEMIVARDLLA